MAEPQTNEGQVQEILSMEELSKKIQDATEELNQLKQGLNNLSLEEQNSRLAEIEASIFDCSESLEELENDNATTINQEQLNTLKSQVDILKSEKESLKQQIEAQVKTEMEALTKSVTTTPASEQNQENNEENSNGGEKKWLGRQREGLTSKQEWKEHTGKNILRALGGIGIIGGTAWLAKKLFTTKDYESEIPGYSQMSRKEKRLARKELRRQKREERREERRERREDRIEEKGGFRDRPVGRFLKGTAAVLGVGSGVYYLSHGLYTKNWGLKDLFDRERGKKLTFEQALDAAKGNMANSGEGTMAYGMNLQYHEETSELEAYGQKIKISQKGNGKIEGLDVSFTKYEHMISTVIMIAYLKKNYSGRCTNNSPFNWSGGWRGNMNVGSETAVDATGYGGRIVGISTGAVLGIVAGIYGGLSTGAAVAAAGGTAGYLIGLNYDTDNVVNKYFPELDGESGVNILAGYLNSLGCREERKQRTDEISESPIKQEVAECMEEIQSTNPDLQPRGGERKLDAIQDPNDPEKYTIKAYDRNFDIKISGQEGNRKVKILNISGGSPMVECDFSKGDILNLELGLKESIYFSCFIGFLLSRYCHSRKDYPYFNKNRYTDGLCINDSYWNDTEVLSASAFTERMPTLLAHKDDFLKFLNDGMLASNGDSIRKKR